MSKVVIMIKPRLRKQCPKCELTKPLSDFKGSTGKEMTKCRKCYSYCEHNKRKYYCIDCGGSSMCEHNRRKDYCVDCCGSSICEHNRRKDRCINCGEHNKREYRCIDCGELNRREGRCKLCLDNPVIIRSINSNSN